MTLYSGPMGDRGRIPFPELQNVTNYDRIPRRSILDGWPVYRRIAEIDDMVTYIPEDDEEECKMERSLKMMYWKSPVLEWKKAKATVLWRIKYLMYMILYSHLRLSIYLMMGLKPSRLYGYNAERANGHYLWRHLTRRTACATGITRLL